MQHKRRHMHGGQHVANVDSRVHFNQGAGGARAGGGTRTRFPPASHRVVGAGAHPSHVRLERPRPLDRRSVCAPVILGRRPRIIRGAQPLRIRAIEHELAYPLGSRGCEQDRQWAAFRVAEESRPLATHRVHDGTDVVHPSLEVRQPARSIRESRAALVESDQASERAEAVEKVRRAGIVPVEFEVRDESWDEHEIELSVAGDLISDVDIAASGIADGRSHARRGPNRGRPRSRNDRRPPLPR